MLGLYDSQGVLRFAGRDRDDCLAYAELFSLPEDSYSLVSVAVLVRSSLASTPEVALAGV